jgi:ABC-2 type transport system permease protein
MTVVINPPSSTSVGFDVGNLYVPIALLVSLTVGLTFVPQLLIEEKERKTLRMLMVTPASFEDVIVGKLLVALIYQLVLSGVVLAIQGGFTGHVALVTLYALLGACFSLALGLLLGAAFQTSSSAGAAGGIVSTIFIIAGIFVGPLGQLLSSSPVVHIVRLLPTYYVAEGAFNAAANEGSVGSNALDIGVILASTLVLLVISAWILRRQSAVVGEI